MSSSVGRSRRDRSGRIWRQSGLTSLAAAAAVASGLILDVSIAATYGAGRTTDAFFVGARIPLGLVAIMMVAANQALVPAFSNWLVEKSERETWRLVSALLSASVVLGIALAAATSLISVPLMRLTAPGLPTNVVETAASISKIMFFVVPLVLAAEVIRALMNARYSFVAPAAMHIILNAIATAFVVASDGVDIHWVAWGYLVGSVAQLGFILVGAFRRGFRFRPTLAVNDADVIGAARLSFRPLVGAGLNPIARIGEQLVVSFLPAGSVTILNYGYRLISAIGGSILFRSAMVAVIPRLTEATTRGDDAEVARITRLGAKILLTMSIPLTAFMAVLASPAAQALFHRGNFSRAGAALLGIVLAVYAASLVGSAFQRSLLAPFFARLDTRVPLRNTAYGVAANMLLLPALVLPLGLDDEISIVGVAAAYSLAQYVNVAHSWYRLRHDIGIRLAGLRTTTVRLAVATTASAGSMVAGYQVLDLGAPAAKSVLLLKTVVVGLMGVAVLAGLMAVMARREMTEMWRAIRRRRPAREDPDLLVPRSDEDSSPVDG